VHYLYAGSYQALREQLATSTAWRKSSSAAYGAAMTYNNLRLAKQGKVHATLQKDVSIFGTLNLARDTFCPHLER
jgi:hypothetical protein